MMGTRLKIHGFMLYSEIIAAYSDKRNTQNHCVGKVLSFFMLNRKVRTSKRNDTVLYGVKQLLT